MPIRRIALLLVITWVSALGVGVADDTPPLPNDLKEIRRVPPLEPAEALMSFELQQGFRLELLASEPHVASPVAADYDEDGRLYVAEMLAYPYPEKPGERPQGRVRLLEDSDGDGVFDKSHIFADGVPWPTGVVCALGGVYVAAPPDLVFLKDTDGDHQANLRRVVFTGFGIDNVQALFNNLKWGLDHKIYGATAGNGGAIRPGNDPNATPVVIRGHDFRFSPRTETLEPIAGTAQFGNSFDAWDRRFVCSNSDHAQQVVMPAEALARNPYLASTQLLASIAADGAAAPVFRKSPPEPWRVVRTRRRAASGKSFAPTELVPVGFFTSASGITIYLGDAYPPEMAGNLFVGDVGGNLIHRKRLIPAGTVFRAERADPKTEFVRSSDNWFRPVNFVNAPDGTLHVIDMYRETIEHPWSIPEDIKALLDLESGRDRGRIYRLAPPGFTPRPAPRLSQLSSADLVALLAHRNGWHRRTAHRLLWERQDRSVVPRLREMLANAAEPFARAHALWTLAGLSSLEEADLGTALRDPVAEVREQGVRLVEGRWLNSDVIQHHLIALVNDPSSRVRFLTALALGGLPAVKKAAPLARLALENPSDPWLTTAILSSSLDASRLMLERLLEEPAGTLIQSPRADVIRQLSLQVAAHESPQNLDAVLALLARLESEANAATVVRIALEGVGEGLRRRQRSLSDLAADPSRPGREVVTKFLAAEKQTACDARQPLARRLQAVRILELGASAPLLETAEAVMDPRQPPALQQAVVRALARFREAEIAPRLLAWWPTATPTVRAEIVEGLLTRAEWTPLLLQAIAEGKIQASMVPATRQELLRKHRKATIRVLAEKVFTGTATTPRQEVVARYQRALQLGGDRERGRKVFERECMTCHRLGTLGHEVGPNLATIRERGADALLVQILDPNREVLPNYVEYVASLEDGRMLTGIIVAETAANLTLRRAQGVQDVLPRSSLESLRATGKSLMPEGLEKNLTPQDMADLLQFLLHP